VSTWARGSWANASTHALTGGPAIGGRPRFSLSAISDWRMDPAVLLEGARLEALAGAAHRITQVGASPADPGSTLVPSFVLDLRQVPASVAGEVGTPARVAFEEQVAQALPGVLGPAAVWGFAAPPNGGGRLTVHGGPEARTLIGHLVQDGEVPVVVGGHTLNLPVQGAPAVGGAHTRTVVLRHLPVEWAVQGVTGLLLRAAGYSASVVRVREEFFGECRTVRGAANTDTLVALVEVDPAFASEGGVLSLPSDFVAGSHRVEVEVKGGVGLPPGLGTCAPPPPPPPRPPHGPPQPSRPPPPLPPLSPSPPMPPPPLQPRGAGWAAGPGCGTAPMCVDAAPPDGPQAAPPPAPSGSVPALSLPSGGQRPRRLGRPDSSPGLGRRRRRADATVECAPGQPACAVPRAVPEPMEGVVGPSVPAIRAQRQREPDGAPGFQAFADSPGFAAMAEWVRDRVEGAGAWTADGMRTRMLAFYRANAGVCRRHRQIATAAEVPRGLQVLLGGAFGCPVGSAYGSEGDEDPQPTPLRRSPRQRGGSGPQTWIGIQAAAAAQGRTPAGAHARGGRP